MIRSVYLCFAVLLTSQISIAQEKSELSLETAKQKASYGIGLNIGRQMASEGLQIDATALAAGIADMLAKKEPRISQKDLQAAMEAFRKELEERAKKEAEVNQKKATEFLKSNGKKENVKTTKSGLQYIVLDEGDGVKPKATSKVSAHYRGKLINGEVFDESYEGKTPTAEDKPVPFPLDGVIAGWTEGLQLMKQGTKCRLFVPPEMAYGVSGRPGIPPNSLLIFDIELVKVD